eukprot:1369573-Amorphochlora_amoeboformis.AAC.5
MVPCTHEIIRNAVGIRSSTSLSASCPSEVTFKCQAVTTGNRYDTRYFDSNPYNLIPPSKDPNLAFNRPWPQQLAVISGGVFANILSAWSAILIAVALVGVPSPVAGPGISVTAVEKNSPAEAYGFKIGDVITRIGDQ